MPPERATELFKKMHDAVDGTVKMPEVSLPASTAPEKKARVGSPKSWASIVAERLEEKEDSREAGITNRRRNL